MYRAANNEEGVGARIYREPHDVIEEILKVKDKIERIRYRVELKNLLPSLWEAREGGDILELIPQLEGALYEAEESARELRLLEERISELSCELYEIRCERGH